MFTEHHVEVPMGVTDDGGLDERLALRLHPEDGGAAAGHEGPLVQVARVEVHPAAAKLLQIYE